MSLPARLCCLTSENSVNAKFAESTLYQVGRISALARGSGARRLGDREGVAIRVFEVGDLGVSLERGDAPLVGPQPRFVVLLEGDAPLGELVPDPLDVVDAPAGQGLRGLAHVLGGEVGVQHAILRATVLHVVWRVDAHPEAELAFVELPGPGHIRN